jgi:hypothetical protein
MVHESQTSEDHILSFECQNRLNCIPLESYLYEEDAIIVLKGGKWPPFFFYQKLKYP